MSYYYGLDLKTEVSYYCEYNVIISIYLSKTILYNINIINPICKSTSYYNEFIYITPYSVPTYARNNKIITT